MKNRLRVLGVSAFAGLTLFTLSATSSAWTQWRHATSMCRAQSDYTTSDLEWIGAQGPINLVKWPNRGPRTIECGADIVTTDGEIMITGMNTTDNMDVFCTARLQWEDGSPLWTGTNRLDGAGSALRSMFFFPVAGTTGHFSATCSLPSAEGSDPLFYRLGSVTHLRF